MIALICLAAMLLGCGALAWVADRAPAPHPDTDGHAWTPKEPIDATELPQCARCEADITDQTTAYTDPDEVFWVGPANARIWCSLDCHQDDSEDYWTARERWTA